MYYSTTNTGGLHAVRWVDKGAPQDIHGSAFSSSTARRASRDGSVVVGEAYGTKITTEAFVWTASGGMIGLGLLPAMRDQWPAGYQRLANVRLYPQAHELETERLPFFQQKMLGALHGAGESGR